MRGNIVWVLITVSLGAAESGNVSRMRGNIVWILITARLGAAESGSVPTILTVDVEHQLSFRLAIKVNCLLTVVIEIFGNGLGARTIVCWNAGFSGTCSEQGCAWDE
jgi:hypothetical protein